MPNLTAHAATLRAGQHGYRGFLATVPQTVVCQATVTSTPSFPALALAISVTHGNIAAVRRGMTVRVETSGGVFKGLLRVASAGAITSTSLPINEVSAGTVNVTAGDVLKVVAEWRIWDMLVAASAALEKDSRVAYAAQLSDPPPVANAGGAAVGWGTTAEVAFDASASFAVDPDSSGTLTYSWDFVDGTPASSTSATPTVTFPAGFRWVTLTVTDASNGVSASKVVPVWVFDDVTLKPTPVVMTALEGTVEDGWRAAFELVDAGASVGALPDGALVVYVELERYGSSEVSYGSGGAPGRSAIKFVGYLLSATVTVEPGSDVTRFEAVGPLGVLQQTPALSQLLISKTTPTNWQEVKALTLARALWYLYHWQTTIGTAFDTLKPDAAALSGAALQRLAVTDVSSAAGQLRDLASAINLRVSCDRLGRLTFVRDFNMLSAADRAARVNAYHLTADDLLSLTMTVESRAPVKLVRAEGVTTAGTPVFSRAPGSAPAPFGPAVETLGRQIVLNQADLNTRAGRYFAAVNHLYWGRPVPYDATVTLPDGYDVFDPAYGETVTLTLPASSSRRGLAFTTATRWVVMRAAVEHDADSGTKTVRLTLSHETDGPDGQTVTPPTQADISLQLPMVNLGWELPGWTADTATTRTTFGARRIAVFATSHNELWVTQNFNTPSTAGGPTWSVVNLASLSNWNGNFIEFVVDAYSPLYLGTGTAVNGWIVTTTRLLRIQDIFGTPSLASRHTFIVAPVNPRKISATRGVQNHVVAASNYGNNATYPGVWVTYTTNDVTYTEVQVTPHYNTQPRYDTPRVHISERESGVVYVPAYTTTASFNSATVRLYRSADYGATWSVSAGKLAFTSQYVLPLIYMPYGVAAANVMYRGDILRSGINDVHRTFRVTSSGETDISPAGPEIAIFMKIDDSDANHAILSTYGPSGFKNYMTQNLGATTPIYNAVPPGGDATAIVGRQLYFLGSGAIFYSGDNGATWDNRLGNIPSSRVLINLCGG